MLNKQRKFSIFWPIYDEKSKLLNFFTDTIYCNLVIVLSNYYLTKIFISKLLL